MRRRLLVATTLTPVGVLGVAGVALAFWTVASTGASGTAAADTLNPPQSVSTSAVTFSSVTINVTAGPSAGPTPTSYRVDRTGPTSVSGVCSISGTTGSCADPNPVQGATNTYAVFSKLGDNWVAASSATTSAAVPTSDSTAPTTTATPSPAANGAGWNNANLSVLLSATDNSGGSGVKQITYAATGAQTISTTTVSGASTSVGITVEGTTTLTFFATDNANNVEGTESVTIKLDKTGPSNVLSLTGTTGNASFLSGSTVYYQGQAAGSFQIRNALTDALSGPASSATAALAGTSTGWTHTATTVSTPTGGPYVSGSFSWAGSTTSSPTETLTGRDVADNTAPSSLTFTNDVTGPTGGSVTYSSSNTTSSSVSVGFATGTDAGAGVNAGSALLQRSTAAYTAGLCQSFGSFSTIATAPSSSPFADTLPSDGCFKYQYLVSDNVGNTTAYTNPNIVIRDNASPTVTVTAPTSPTNSSSQNYAVLFSEPVSDLTATGVTVTAPAGNTGLTKSVSKTDSTHFTITVTGLKSDGSGDGTITVNVNAAAVTDPAGNSNTISNTASVTYDRTAPTLASINRAAGSTNPTNTGPLNFTVTFSEPVNSVLAARFTVATSGTGGTAPTIGTPSPVGGSSPATAWTVAIGTTGTTGTNSGAIGLNMTSTTGVSDAASNALSGSGIPFTGQTFTYDTTAPTVTNVQSFQSDGTTAGNGLMEAGDKLVVTFNSAINPANVPLTGIKVVEDRQNNSNVTLTISNSSGSINLVDSSGTGSAGYVGSNGTKSATATGGTAALSSGNTVLTITVGTSFAGTAPSASSGTLVLQMSSQSIADVAGNSPSSFSTLSTFKLF